jgi:hypothetical protein
VGNFGDPQQFGQTSAGKDFENKFEIRGELGWEYAGMTKDSDGVDFYVWKRSLEG